MMGAMEELLSMPSNSSMIQILLMRLALSTLPEDMTTARYALPSILAKTVPLTNHASFLMNITHIPLINMHTCMEKMQ
jgi:hypothetical protein